MTSALRKIHRNSWFVLAVLLPLAWIAAIRAIPGEFFQQPVRAAQADPLPLTLASRQSGDFVVSLRTDSSGLRNQIEIIITQPLTNPNTTVTVNGKSEIILGTRGIRRFEPDSATARNRPLTLRFEDKIQGRLLRTVIFE